MKLKEQFKKEFKNFKTQLVVQDVNQYNVYSIFCLFFLLFTVSCKEEKYIKINYYKDYSLRTFNGISEIYETDTAKFSFLVSISSVDSFTQEIKIKSSQRTGIDRIWAYNRNGTIIYHTLYNNPNNRILYDDFDVFRDSLVKSYGFGPLDKSTNLIPVAQSNYKTGHFEIFYGFISPSDTINMLNKIWDVDKAVKVDTTFSINGTSPYNLKQRLENDLIR